MGECTGRVTVCRTFDELLDVLGRFGVPRAAAETDLLGAAAAGLEPLDRWATWDRQPFSGGDYAVSVHRRPRR